MSDKLIELFSKGLGVPADDLSEESTPKNTASWDSLAAMKMVTLIEDAFDTRLKTKDIMRMNSIGMARNVLAEKGIAEF